jgi:hypothetical protein
LTRRYIIDGAHSLLDEGRYAAATYCVMMLTNDSETIHALLPGMTDEDRRNTMQYLGTIFTFHASTPQPAFVTRIREAEHLVRDISNQNP